MTGTEGSHKFTLTLLRARCTPQMWNRCSGGVCCPSLESLRRRTDRGCRAPEAGNPGKGTLDGAKNGQSSAVPAPGPLGPGDSVAEKDHGCSVPDAVSLSPSNLFDFLSCFGEGPCNGCSREGEESACTDSVYEGF